MSTDLYTLVAFKTKSYKLGRCPLCDSAKGVVADINVKVYHHYCELVDRELWWNGFIYGTAPVQGEVREAKIISIRQKGQ